MKGQENGQERRRNGSTGRGPKATLRREICEQKDVGDFCYFLSEVFALLL